MPVQRRAARVLLVADGSVLLIKGRDPGRPETGPWWHTPGGGIDRGEGAADAAAREVLEETGLHVEPEDLGPVIAARVAHFDFGGRRYHQTESFFAVEVPYFMARTGGWDDTERGSLIEHRWWTADELLDTREVVYPGELATLLDAVLDGSIDRPLQLAEQTLADSPVRTEHDAG